MKLIPFLLLLTGCASLQLPPPPAGSTRKITRGVHVVTHDSLGGWHSVTRYKAGREVYSIEYWIVDGKAVVK